MPKYTLKASDGASYTLDSPNELTQDQLNTAFSEALQQSQPTQQQAPQQQPAQPQEDIGIGGRVLRAAQNVPSRLGQQASDFGTGALTSFYGLGQGTANLAGGVSEALGLPGQENVARNVDKINAFMRQREQQIAAEDAARTNQGLFNVPRTVGEITSAAAMYPYKAAKAAGAIPKVSSPLMEGAKRLGRVAREGAIGSVLFTPSTGEGDYTTQKAVQAGTGALAGLGFAGGGKVIGAAGGAIAKKIAGKTPTETLPVNLDQLKFADIQSMAGTNKDADIRAVNKVVDELKKQFPDNYQSVINEWATSGKPLMDVIPRQISGLAETSAMYPQGEELAQKYFSGQAAGSAERINKAIAENVSPIGKDVADIVAERVKLGQETAAPLYKEAFQSMGNKPVTSQRLQTLLEDPAYKAALKEGLVTEERNARIAGEKFNPYDYGTLGYDANGNLVLPKTPNLKLLDLIKRSLNSQLKSGNYTDPATGRLTETGRQLTSLNSNLVDEIDNILGPKHPYARARQIAGDYLSVESSTLKGQKDFFSTRPDVLKREFRKLTPAQQAAYKDGAVSAARARMGTILETGGNPYPKLMGKTDDVKRWQEILSPQEFKNFYESLKAEDILFQTRNRVLGNSATARRQNLIKDFELSGAEVLTGAGTIKTIGLSKLSGWLKRRTSGLTDNMAGSVAKVLYEDNPRQKALLMKQVFGDERLSESEKKMIKDVYVKAEGPIEELKVRLRAGASATAVNAMQE
jgi:hypothetical protein